MTAEPWELAAEPFDVIESTVLAEIARAGRKYVIRALGTFCLLSTVGVVLCIANPFAALGIGAILMVMVYAGGHRAVVSQIITGALAGIAFLTFGSAGR